MCGSARRMKTQPTHSPADHPKREQFMQFIRLLSPNSDPRVFELMGLMRSVAHALYQLGEESLDETGLSVAQYRILTHLLFSEQMEDRPSLNPSELSERHGTSRNTVSALIRSLEDGQLIVRALDVQDRRKFNICLTPAGRELVQDNARRHFNAIDAAFNALSADEITTFIKLLQKLGSASALGPA